MKKNKNNLIWLDLEMTGLDPFKDRILEIATIITDKNLKILAEGPNIAIYQINSILSSMNDWNINIHNKNGLLNRVKTSSYNETRAEQETLKFLKKWSLKNTSPICGNSIYNDRFFLLQYMPKLFSYFHYRSIDVSSIKELFKLWNNNKNINFLKIKKHTAKHDIYESINELKFYRKNFFILKDFKINN